MVASANDEMILTLKASPLSGCEEAFLDWKKRLNATAASSPGFVSIEISRSSPNADEWVVTQRFSDINTLKKWQESEQCLGLMDELNSITERESLRCSTSKRGQGDNGVTEVIVTRVNPGKEREFRNWIASIHEVEAQFPGFRSAYVQSPAEGEIGTWITLLQFDTNEHLDHWLQSGERKELLKEMKTLVETLEQHRVISPYGGWFAPIAEEGGAPPNWKQAMVVLLVLFPIVVLEIKFLSPHTAGLGVSLSTFVGNAISIALVTWAMMPLAISGLGWWLKNSCPPLKSALGILLVFLLYAAEIMLFQNLSFPF